MSLRKRRLPVFLVGLFALTAPAMAARGQTIVVTAKSASELAGDLEFLIKAVAPDEPQAQGVLDALKQFQAGDLIKGLDRGRGFGVALSLPKEFPQGGPPSIVAAVPVTDLGQFLDSIKDLGLPVDNQPGVPGFSHKVTLPDGNSALYVLEAKGYALFSLVPDGVDRLKAMDVSSWWKKGRPETVLSIKINVSELPDSLRDQILTQFEARAEDLKARQPGENDAQFRGRIAGQEFGNKLMKGFINETGTLALDLDFNRKNSEVAMELAVSGRPGTDMAKTLRSFGEARSRFEGLGRDAAVAGWMRLPLSRGLADGLGTIFDDNAKGQEERLDNDGQKDVFKRSITLIKSILNAPELDLGLAIRHGAKAGKEGSRLMLLSGMSLPDSGAAERLARDAAARFELENGFKVKFDVARAADGTAIHQLTVPYDDKDEEDAYLLKTFGKGSLYFAFPRGSVVASFGQDTLESLRTAIADSSAPRPGKTSEGPVAATIRLGGLADMMDTDKEREEFRKAAAEVFRGDDAKRDRMTLGIKPDGDGIRVRLSMDIPALRMLAEIGDDDE